MGVCLGEHMGNDLSRGSQEREATQMTLEEIQAMSAKVKMLEEMTEAHKNGVEYLRDLLREMAEEGEINPDVAERIGNVFDLDLSQEIEGTVTVTFSFSARLQIGETVEDLAFSADLESTGVGDVAIYEESIEIDA